MDIFTFSVLYRYLRACLLIMPYLAILIVGGHGAVPLGLLLYFGGLGGSFIVLGWIGIIIALIAPLVPWRVYRGILVTAAAAALIASATILSSAAALGPLEFFHGCAALFLILEWFVILIPRATTVA